MHSQGTTALAEYSLSLPSGPESRQVRYSLTPEDVYTFTRYHASRRKQQAEREARAKRNTAFPLVSLFLVAILTLVLFVAPLDEVLRFLFQFLVGFAGAVVAAAFLVVLFVRVFGRRAVERQFANGRNWRSLAERTLAISPDGLRTASEWANTFLKWEAVADVAETDDYIYIYDTDDSAHVVPRRAFPDEARSVEFFALARKYFEQYGPQLE